MYSSVVVDIYSLIESYGSWLLVATYEHYLLANTLYIAFKLYCDAVSGPSLPGSLAGLPKELHYRFEHRYI